MAIYNNRNASSAITRVEFAPMAEGNFSFFHVDAPQHEADIKAWLASKGQILVAETAVNGRPVLVTRGELDQDRLLESLAQRGEQLAMEPPRRKPMDTWKVISMLAVPGQMMQLASSFMKKDRKLDWGLFTFAASNLAGHIIGWIYGSQKSDDVHQLRYVKEQVNDQLGAYLPEGGRLPGINEDRSALREGPVSESTKQWLNRFLKKHSVSVGEIFLRYFGAFGGMAFPTGRWGKTWEKLKVGDIKGAYTAGRNPSIVHWAGMGSLSGKTLALFAKVDDPYDPKPQTAFDKFRSDYIFNVGGNIEALSFATMAYEAMTNPKNTIMFRGKEYQNYLSAFGAGLFTVRYLIRNFAKYGEKQLDTDEMYAHVSDSLAQMPPEKLPQLVADTAADIVQHFKTQELDYSEVFNALMMDLYRYHHISLESPASESPQCPAATAASVLADGPRRPQDRATRSESYVRTAQKPPESCTPCLGA